MQYTTLGRTGFRVSRMGLGCGGHSRLGIARGNSAEEAERVVHEAVDLGVTFIDTAETYGTEEVVGRALAGGLRSKVVLSTKVGATWEGERANPRTLETRLDGCLHRLRTDHVDVFHLHGVRAEDYAFARDELLPVLFALKERGKIRAVGITEAFAPDPTHRMLAPAVREDDWEVVMVGFNILNQSARERVLRATQEKGVGTLCMFAVRRALSRPEVLREVVADLSAKGEIDASEIDLDDPLGFIAAESLQEAAYRFCLGEPGLDVILSGTGSLDHLRENAKILGGDPLSTPDRERLAKLFAGVDSVSGN